MIYVAWFIIGAVIGFLSVLFQFSTIRDLKTSSGGKAVALYIGGMLLRLLVIGVMFYFALRSGLWQTGLCLLGLILSRWVSLVVFNKHQNKMVKEP